ncbi:MAG: endonuclease III, partial [Myxococcota bacterium]
VTTITHVARVLEATYGTPQRNTDETVLDGLIGTILSQNTTGSNSSRAFQALKRRFPTWEYALDADVEEIEEAIRIAGLARVRSQRIQGILHQLREERGALDLEFLRTWPDDDVHAYLTRFKGVGVKTAACVQLFTLGRDDFAVDTHIWRLAKRLGWVETAASRDGTYQALNPIVPDALKHSLHVNLIRHGRRRCKAQRPHCGNCVLLEDCAYGRRVHLAQHDAH